MKGCQLMWEGGVWKRWRREKGEIGKIPCVSGEKNVEPHLAQQTPRAIHRIHFEESKTSCGSAENKTQDDLQITDSIFVLQTSQQK